MKKTILILVLIIVAMFSLIGCDNKNNNNRDLSVKEMSLDEAIRNYPKTDCLKYFEKHLDEYETLSGDQINNLIKSNGGSLRIKTWDRNYNADKGEEIIYDEYTFSEERRGKENGLAIWLNVDGPAALMPSYRHWDIKNDVLQINHVDYTIKAANDQYYLLVVDSNPKVYGIAY